MNDTSVPARPLPSPNQKWRASGSSSLTASRTSARPEQVAVEGRRALQVRADRGDVVQAEQAHAPRLGRRQLGHARNPRPPERARKARRSGRGRQHDDHADGQQGDLRQRGQQEERHGDDDRARRGQERRVRAEAREVLAHGQLEAGEATRAKPAGEQRAAAVAVGQHAGDDQHQREQDDQLDERERRPRRRGRLAIRARGLGAAGRGRRARGHRRRRGRGRSALAGATAHVRRLRDSRRRA